MEQEIEKDVRYNTQYVRSGEQVVRDLQSLGVFIIDYRTSVHGGEISHQWYDQYIRTAEYEERLINKANEIIQAAVDYHETAERERLAEEARREAVRQEQLAEQARRDAEREAERERARSEQQTRLDELGPPLAFLERDADDDAFDSMFLTVLLTSGESGFNPLVEAIREANGTCDTISGAIVIVDRPEYSLLEMRCNRQRYIYEFESRGDDEMAVTRIR